MNTASDTARYFISHLYVGVGDGVAVCVGVGVGTGVLVGVAVGVGAGVNAHTAARILPFHAGTSLSSTSPAATGGEFGAQKPGPIQY
jgi:hypothetical protein